MAFYVFDLDGTLADPAHRKSLIARKDWRGFFAAVGDDEPIDRVIGLLRDLHGAGAKIEIWSGRSDECRDETEAWLRRHGVETGFVVFPRPEAPHLVAIKTAKLPYAAVAEEIDELLPRIEAASLRSSLPEDPDLGWIEDFVFDAHRSVIVQSGMRTEGG